MSRVQQILENAETFWKDQEPYATAKWFNQYNTAIFAGSCHKGQCEPKRDGTSTAPAFLSPTEFAEKKVKVKYAVCPLCGEGDWEPMRWELASMAINEWPIYLDAYQEKLDQISNFKSLSTKPEEAK